MSHTMNLDNLKQSLIARAKRDYGDITPCGVLTDFDKCFQFHKLRGKKHLVFYFNYIKNGELGWTGTVKKILE